ncbi:nucleoside-diphosphate sugar epimerase/dehydratase [Thioalkalicoccus limnaeus]|uniref:Nucleoside-diphosphate sugar epimerase/dehydratase n=1 Tax=Thioalkalicoccus limnaeus TaxID=120681 RepID=A0ABV4BDP8_9GAMM
MSAPWIERLRSRFVVLLHDVAMIPVAWFLAYWMRFNLGYVPPEFIEAAVDTLPIVILVLGLVYWLFGLYRGVWRFASMTDLVRIAKAVLVGTTLLLFLLFALNRLAYMPRSVPVLFVIFQLLLLAGPRLFYRLIKDRHFDWDAGQRVLIVGAGRAGEMLARDMLRDTGRAYNPVAFVDDKLRRQGGDVHGVPIRGTSDQIPTLVERLAIDLIVLAVPSASASQMRRLVNLCEAASRPFRTVPELNAMMSGQVTVRQLRSVSIEDLLGRNPVTLDWPTIHEGLAGRTILVTGAGGSIGSELCRQLMPCRPKRLILVDHSEHNLYRIEMALSDSSVSVPFSRHLLDITDPGAITRLFRETPPDIVFHAAAYKHVPMLEDQVCAAVLNNTLGTEIVAAAAAASGCERFVLISTDKAVNPTNVMGASKRAAELLCQDLDRRSRCRFIVVRFGNVLGSAGSVVPRFRRQIEQGGPVTVTHPDIERFFMTIPEACQLIMQAAVLGRGGETFVLEMGDPIKIRYLAEQMIQLSGKRPGQDIAIEYIGLRPGEKLHEELFYTSEDLLETPHPKIRIASSAIDIDAERVRALMDRLRHTVQRLDDSAVTETLNQMVPSWRARPLASNGTGTDGARIDSRSTELPSSSRARTAASTR